MKKAENTEDIDYRKIKDVTEKIREGKMSFIIGAGFSKNISSKYLSWKELLHDMITEMYEDERQTWHASDDELINKYGYLGIASEYVRRKGYHEAIDDYISERTPVLVPNSNGKYELKLNDKIMVDQNGESVSADVSCHKWLLALGAPAIYTFNYDNALDVYQDNIITDKEKEKFQNLISDIDRLKDAQERCKEIINIQTNENCNFSSDGGSYATSQDKILEDSMISELNKELESFDIQPKISQPENLEAINSVINKKENELNRLQQSLEKKYLIVKNSSKISESGNQRCIFKIHGSIKKEREKFGFDEDHHLQYIICQEDYDSYLKKHEAFVDLMRISLMRDSFCIIGFSCDDPNFMLWLNWVKDIKDRSQEVSQNDKLRKFFINVDNSNLPKDKQLLLKNHHIEIINLYEVYKNAKNCNERMKLFLRNIQLTIAAEKSSAALWNSIHLINQSDKNNKSIKYDQETLDHFWETSKLSLPHLSIYSHTGSDMRNDLLYSILGFIQNHQLSTSIAKILLMGMDEENLPFDKILSNMDLQDKFHSQLDYKELLPLFDDYEILNNTLSCIGSSDSKPGPCSSKEYIDILNDFYLFNIDSAIDKLKKWKPTDIYSKVVDMVMKCTFQDVMKVQDSDLELFLDNKQYRSDQEYLSVLQILLYSKPSNTYSSAILRKINELCGANRNLIKLSDYVDSIITATKEKEEIKPLGSFSKSFSFSYDEDALSSCKLIVMLAKGGIFTVMNRHPFIKKEDWYQVLTKIYTKYPCACLFYTSLYGDKNLAIRVAQLYTFSPDKAMQKPLKNILPSILNTSTSPNLSPDVINTMFIYAQYFIRIVKADFWQETFKKLFKEKHWIEKYNDHFYDAVNNFVVQALRYVNDEEFCNRVITQCLAKGTNITNYQNDLVISASSSINKLDSDCLSALKTFMNKVTQPVQTYVVFNLRTYLSAVSFHHWMNTLPQELLQDPITLKAYCVQRNKRNTNSSLNLLKSISENPKLWNTGMTINGDEISFGDSFYLDIVGIERFVKIHDVDILQIYSKMVSSLKDLHFAIEEKKVGEWFNSFGSLIYSMYIFMDQHSQLLNSQSDFNSNKAKCKELYKIINGEESILKMLASGDDYKINEAIREMMTGIEIYRIENFENEYKLLVNIVLQKKTKVLHYALFILIWTIKKDSHFFKRYHFAPFFHLILHNYALYFIGENCPEWNIEADKDYVERCMIYLNKWLAENDSEDEEWKDYQAVFIQPTEFTLISKNKNSEKRKL